MSIRGSFSMILVRPILIVSLLTTGKLQTVQGVSENFWRSCVRSFFIFNCRADISLLQA